MPRGKIPFRMHISYLITVLIGASADVWIFMGHYSHTYQEWFLVCFFGPLLTALLSVAVFKYSFYSIFKIDPGEFRFNGLQRPLINDYLIHPSLDIRRKAKFCLWSERMGANTYIWLLVTAPATLKLSLIS